MTEQEEHAAMTALANRFHKACSDANLPLPLTIGALAAQIGLIISTQTDMEARARMFGTVTAMIAGASGLPIDGVAFVSHAAPPRTLN